MSPMVMIAAIGPTLRACALDLQFLPLMGELSAACTCTRRIRILVGPGYEGHHHKKKNELMDEANDVVKKVYATAKEGLKELSKFST